MVVEPFGLPTFLFVSVIYNSLIFFYYYKIITNRKQLKT
nr:MAG TPA: hypothetical protein [Caudoviricetes sp.]